MKMHSELITLGADVGGKDAHLATHSHIMKFRNLLSEVCRDCYGDVVKEIALVLRIDGAVQSWHKSGVHGVRFLKKNSVVTADIYVPSAAWKSENDNELDRVIANGILSSLNLIKNHGSFKKTDLNMGLLIEDVNRKLKNFC